MKSQRQLQIGENIKRVLADIFAKEDIISAPGSHITILEADVSPDAKNVKIYIDIFGNEKLHKQIIENLNEISPNIRYLLGKKVALRNIPEIKFLLDDTGKNLQNIESLIASESKNLNIND